MDMSPLSFLVVSLVVILLVITSSVCCCCFGSIYYNRRSTVSAETESFYQYNDSEFSMKGDDVDVSNC